MSMFGAKGDTLNLLALFFIMMPSFLWYGYNMSVLGGVLTVPSFYNQFPVMNTVTTTGEHRHRNSTIQGTVSALYTVGAMFGALSTTFFGDKLGRRKMIFLSSLLSMIGAILMTASFSVAQLIVGRIVLGAGVGIASGSVPVYQTEISTVRNRGKHVSFTGFFITSGILLGYWVDYGCSYIKNSASWRVPIACQIPFCVMSMSCIFLLPESPRWLIKKNRIDDAKHVLHLFHENDEQVNAYISSTIASYELMASSKFSDIFKMGESRVFQRVCLALFAMFTSQACGINAITFYASTIFQQYLNMSTKGSSLLSGCVEIIQPFGALLCILTVESVGRRKLLLVSGIIMGISMVLLAGTTSQLDNKKSLHAAIAWLFTVNFGYSYGFLGCCFVYGAEILPTRIQSQISGISLFVTWATNFLVVEVTPVGFDSIAYKYYIVYACTNFFLIVPFIYFFFPETSGRSIEEIDEIFIQSRSWFDTVKISHTMPKGQKFTISPDESEKLQRQHLENAGNSSDNTLTS